MTTALQIVSTLASFVKSLLGEDSSGSTSEALTSVAEIAIFLTSLVLASKKVLYVLLKVPCIKKIATRSQRARREFEQEREITEMLERSHAVNVPGDTAVPWIANQTPFGIVVPHQVDPVESGRRPVTTVPPPPRPERPQYDYNEAIRNRIRNPAPGPLG